MEDISPKSARTGGVMLFAAPASPRVPRGAAPPTRAVEPTCSACDWWADGCTNAAWAEAPSLAGALEPPGSEFAARSS